MARPRNSLLRAAEKTMELVKKEKMTLEEAAKKASAEFNETVENIIDRINTQSRLSAAKATTQKRTHSSARNYYVYHGNIAFAVDGRISELTVTIPTKESEFSKAKDYVNKNLFERGFRTHITEKQFEENLSTARA